MLNSTTTRSRLANRKPTTVTNLEVDTNSQLQHVVTLDRASIPTWEPMLGEIDANLRSIKDFFLPLGGHNFDVKDLYGRTMLHKAAHMGYEAAVEYLVLHGANIYAQDDEGITPLVEAKRSGNHSLATLMLEKCRAQEYLNEEEMKKKKDRVKLAFALLNVGLELGQAIVSQELATYRWLGVILAFICLVVSVSEMVYEAKRERVEWKKRGLCYWFYYPGRKGRSFGSFMLWFGLASSIAQVCLNLVALKMKTTVLKFDYLGLLLSVFYLMARFGGRERKMKGEMEGKSECTL